MGRVAYTIEDAAEAAGGIPESIIALAIRNRELPAYRINNQAITLREDLTEWVRTRERF